MENTAVVVLMAVIGVVAACILCAAAGLVYWDFRKNIQALTTALGRVQAMDERTATLPATVEALLRMGQSMAENVVSLSRSVDHFQANLFSDPAGKAAYTPYSEAAAGDAYNVSEMMNGGLSRQAAMDKLGLEQERFRVGI